MYNLVLDASSVNMFHVELKCIRGVFHEIETASVCIMVLVFGPTCPKKYSSSVNVGCGHVHADKCRHNPLKDEESCIWIEYPLFSSFASLIPTKTTFGMSDGTQLGKYSNFETHSRCRVSKAQQPPGG